MIQLAAGVFLGMSITTVAAMVVACIYLEKKHPELREQLQSEEMEK